MLVTLCFTTEIFESTKGKNILTYNVKRLMLDLSLFRERDLSVELLRWKFSYTVFLEQVVDRSIDWLIMNDFLFFLQVFQKCMFTEWAVVFFP